MGTTKNNQVLFFKLPSILDKRVFVLPTYQNILYMCVKPRIRKISVAGCGLINSRVLWLHRRATASSKKTKRPQKQPFKRGTTYNGLKFDGQKSSLFQCIFYVIGENSKINCMSLEAETMRQWRCSILRKEENTWIFYASLQLHVMLPFFLYHEEMISCASLQMLLIGSRNNNLASINLMSH